MYSQKLDETESCSFDCTLSKNGIPEKILQIILFLPIDIKQTYSMLTKETSIKTIHGKDLVEGKKSGMKGRCVWQRSGLSIEA